MEKKAPASTRAYYASLCKFVPEAMRCECGWGVQAFLPSKEYRNFLKDVAADPARMEATRAFIEESVNSLLEGTLRPGSKVLVGWTSDRGAYFNFEDSCNVGVQGEDVLLERYTSCNVDSPQQALPLLACLTFYMSSIMAETMRESPSTKSIYKNIPTFSKGFGGWGLGLRLPEDCAKMLPLIAGDKEFRADVENKLKELFKGTLKDSWVKITWARDGAAFYTRGNACEVMLGSGLDYECFNVDTAEQALAFYTCLTVYAKQLFCAMAYKTDYPDGPIKEISSTTLNFDMEGKFETERARAERLVKCNRRGRQDIET